MKYVMKQWLLSINTLYQFKISKQSVEDLKSVDVEAVYDMSMTV